MQRCRQVQGWKKVWKLSAGAGVVVLIYVKMDCFLAVSIGEAALRGDEFAVMFDPHARAPLFQRILRRYEGVVRLLVYEVLRIKPEKLSDPHGGVGGDGAAARRSLAQAAVRNAGGLRHRGGAQAVGCEKFFAQDDAWVGVIWVLMVWRA